MDEYEIQENGYARIKLRHCNVQNWGGTFYLMVDEMEALLLADTLTAAAAKIIDPRGEDTAKRRSEGAKTGWEVRRAKEQANG